MDEEAPFMDLSQILYSNYTLLTIAEESAGSLAKQWG